MSISQATIEPRHGRPPKPPREYALYNGDEFIDIGTKKELSERYGLSVATIDWLSSPSGMARTGGKGWVIVRFDD